MYVCMYVCVVVESSGEDSQVAAEVDNLTAVTLEVRVFCSSVVLLVACSYGSEWWWWWCSLILGGPLRNHVPVCAAVSAGDRVRRELARQREALDLVLVGHRYVGTWYFSFGVATL
jgi:hypothetical protein